MVDGSCPIDLTSIAGFFKDETAIAMAELVINDFGFCLPFLNWAVGSAKKLVNKSGPLWAYLLLAPIPGIASRWRVESESCAAETLGHVAQGGGGRKKWRAKGRWTLWIWRWTSKFLRHLWTVRFCAKHWAAKISSTMPWPRYIVTAEFLGTWCPQIVNHSNITL